MSTLIPVCLDGIIHGEMEEHLLTPDHATSENDHEKTVVTQYRYQGKVVHRSVHVTLKRGLGIEGHLGSFR